MPGLIIKMFGPVASLVPGVADVSQPSEILWAWGEDASKIKGYFFLHLL